MESDKLPDKGLSVDIRFPENGNGKEVPGSGEIMPAVRVQWLQTGVYLASGNFNLTIEAYTRSEKRDSGNKEYDVVLVGVDTITDLKRAYPNYFVDMGDFLHHLEEIMAKN